MSKQIQKQQGKSLSHSERFTLAVEKEYISKGGTVELTDFQKKLIQNYFIKIDSILEDSETRRMRKTEQYREAVPYDWKNINIKKLAFDVVAYSSLGLDPAQDNHIHPIPYKNNANNNYDITFIMGYNGIELKAKKYGLDVPDDIVCELVYSTDKFKQHKKDRNNDVEAYDFETTNDFDRGDIIGGFYYKVWKDNPQKNKLRVFSKKDLDKRKPKYASVEFYGGEKKSWSNGKPSGKQKVEGWAEEMHLKNIKRAAWNSIIIDSSKIDDHLRAVLDSDAKAELLLESEIEEKANKKVIDFQHPEPQALNAKSETNKIPDFETHEYEEVDEETGEIKEEKTKEAGGPGF